MNLKTTGSDNPETLARLDDIADKISALAPVVASAIERLVTGEINVERAESINRSAEILVQMYELESDLLRRVRTR